MSSKAGMVTIDFDDKDVQSALKRATDGVRPMVTSELEGAGKTLRADMRRRLTKHGKGGGRLWRAIEYCVVGRAQSLRVEVGPRVGDPGVEPYDVVIDAGRRPGSKMPPAEPVREWMDRKGIPEEAEFPIRRAIGLRGLRGQPFPFIGTAAEHSAALLKAADRVLTFVRNQFG